MFLILKSFIFLARNNDGTGGFRKSIIRHLVHGHTLKDVCGANQLVLILFREASFRQRIMAQDTPISQHAGQIFAACAPGTKLYLLSTQLSNASTTFMTRLAF